MRHEEDLHDQLATLFRMPARFIKGILFVAPSPDFAEEHGAWPIIVEQTQDRHDPTAQTLRLQEAHFWEASLGSRFLAQNLASQIGFQDFKKLLLEA